MELNWSLDVLYKSFEDPNFANDKKKFDLLFDELKKIAQTEFQSLNNPERKIEKYLKKYINTTKVLFRLLSFGDLTLSINVKNKASLEIIEHCEKKLVELTGIEVLFKKFIKNIDNLNNVIKKSDFLKEHNYYLNEIKSQTEYMLSEQEEIAIATMKTTGSMAWQKLQQTLTSSLMINVQIGNETKKLPLSNIRNLAFDKNKKTRINAYNAELEAYKNIDDSIAACLNSIKGEIITESNLRGYESVLDKTLKDFRLKKKTLNAMLDSIKENLPYFSKYLRKKAELLGHKNGLPFYDIFAPIGEINLQYTEEEAKNFIINCFNSFSSKLGDLAKKAFDNRWIDFSPKEGKKGGAFCINMFWVNESRILTNFTGSFSDVTTIAHELGHAYHGENLFQESDLNCNYTSPIAETASIFCETIVKNAALQSVSKEEAFAILEQDISDSTQVISDIYSRFLFEDEVIKRRNKSSLSVEELKEIMINSQKEAFLDGLDHEFLHPYMWIPKSHYYSADRNYYNFPYAFGILFSKGLYAIYLKNKEDFVKKYDNLLALTGKNDIEDVAKFTGIDITKKEFWDESLNLIKQDINKFINL